MNKRKKIDHCCEKMNFFLNEQKIAIYYNPIYREYFIRLWSYPAAKHVIYACPWCGYTFKPSLIDKYFEILESEYKIVYNDYLERYFEAREDEYDIEINLPEEFKSDIWWKKRNL